MYAAFLLSFGGQSNANITWACKCILLRSDNGALSRIHHPPWSTQCSCGGARCGNESCQPTASASHQRPSRGPEVQDHNCATSMVYWCRHQYCIAAFLEKALSSQSSKAPKVIPYGYLQTKPRRGGRRALKMEPSLPERLAKFRETPKILMKLHQTNVLDPRPIPQSNMSAP